MSRSFAALENEVKDLIKDSDGYVSSTALTNAVKRGLTRLSECRPRYVVQDWTGNGVAKVFNLPTESYEGGFSDIVKVQYPYDVTGAVLPNTLLPSSLTLFDVGSGSFKLHVGFIPADEKVVRVTFTARHNVTGDASTITSASDEDAVIHWAAAECLKSMAAKAVALGDALIGADNVSYQTRAGQYQSLAKLYEDMSGLQDTPAFSFAKVNVRRLSGESHLTH